MELPLMLMTLWEYSKLFEYSPTKKGVYKMNIIWVIGFIFGLIFGKEIALKIEDYKKDKRTRENIKDYCNYQANRTNGQKQQMYKKIAEIF